MWIKPLIISMLGLMDLMLLVLFGSQLAAHKPLGLNLLLPTLFFNFFGWYLLRVAGSKD